MSFVTYAELLKGAERCSREPEVLLRLDNMVWQIPVSYPSDVRICRHYAEHFTRVRQAGTPIGAHDLWIACHALAEGATILTNYLREFECIEGLPVQSWLALA